jgi:hypothetical protein
VADLSPRRPVFDARQFHVKCVVDTVALGQVRVILLYIAYAVILLYIAYTVVLLYIAYTDSLPSSQKTQNDFIINTNLAVCCETNCVGKVQNC